MAHQKDIVKEVVQVLHDGQKGFSDLAEHIKDPQVKALFLKESQTRAQYASELEAAAGLERDDSGTAGGAMHRAWGDLKGKMGGGDHTLLETAEQGEDAAKKAYEEALQKPEVTGNIRQILEKQLAHLLQSHDKVKTFRDSKAACGVELSCDNGPRFVAAFLVPCLEETRCLFEVAARAVNRQGR